MPTPTGSSPNTFVILSSNTQTNALIDGTKWWGGAGTLSLSYSFLGNTAYFDPYYSDAHEPDAYFVLSAGQQAAATKALATWSAVANISFSKITESNTQVGTLRFGGYWNMDADAAAWAYMPDSTPSAGDVWIGPNTGATPQAGDFDYLTFVHEIGHALGLKHPFEPGSSNGTILPAQYDNVRYTVMSYTDPYYFEPTTPMLLDIAAIQYIYGANMSWQTGNNTYKWAAGTSVFETIWDAGGTDTIDGSNQLDAVAINLNAGSFSSIGKKFWDGSSYINNCLAIAYGANIENATGSGYNDRLTGNGLNNVLNGAAGADVMIGGDGSDAYYVDNSGDVVSETNANATTGGTDTVLSYLSAYTLGSNLENLRLLASGAANGTGNALNNTLYAGSGDNRLDGGAGIDLLAYNYASKGITLNLGLTTAQATGGSGTDTVLNFERVSGSAYNDTLTGNSGANYLYGNAGNDVLNGAAGADVMIGGDGSDAYYVDNSGDVVSETNANATTGGTDTVLSYLSAYTLGSNLENLRLLASGAANGIGNALNNTLYAGSGDNRLDGGAGIDLLAYNYASKGITLNLGLTTAQATGGSGTDTVLNFERVSGGAYNDTLTGNSGANYLYGNAGNDVLNGAAGADVMIGGDGSDAYYVDNSGDVVSETNANATTGGTDTVLSYLSAYTLGSNLENLRLLASGAANGTGNALNNTLYSGSGDNRLDGGAGIDLLAYSYASKGVTLNLGLTTAQATGGSGTDTVLNFERVSGSAYNDTLTGNSGANYLYGNAGNDVLNGAAGNDTLLGGSGTDQLSGGLGADIFDFDALTDSVLGSLRDVIKDFKLAEGDKIDLSTLDARSDTSGNDAFTFIGSAAFSTTNAAGQLRYSDGILAGSVDADTAAEFEVQLVGVSSFSSSGLIA
ncbi:M10 family metallopeptidase C-terminal domain-containing protein [Pseudomonas sp. QE6]|uniref:M10 family metallopeptidase C-terminal domain-containing protein n=1 Tax=Pseudomonas sp. QE6 TaxID=3242491 RepID=UPI00352701DC